MLCVWVRWGRVAEVSELSLWEGGWGGVVKLYTCVCTDHLEFWLWLSFSSGSDELLVRCKVSVLGVHLEDVLPSPIAECLFCFCTAKGKHQLSPC